MHLASFAEINDAENGQQIPSFQGTIKKVFDQKTGEGQYGTWWLQNIILQDDHANEITVTWTLEDAWGGDQVGEKYVFTSGRDKKDQLAGIKKEIRDKGGKHYESVKVDDRATVKRFDPDWPEAEHPNVKPYAEGIREQPLPLPKDPPARPNGDSGVIEAKRHLMQSANLYCLCSHAVENVVIPEVNGERRTPELFQAAIATLFIEASRAGIVAKMPTTPLK